MVGDHVALMSRMLHLHHWGEDKHIWPLLRECGAGKVTQIVDVMEEQDERIHQEYLRVGEALAAWRGHAPAGGGDALAVASEPSRHCPRRSGRLSRGRRTRRMPPTHSGCTALSPCQTRR